MNKPIVFLSHSARDKKQLVALKALLKKKSAGFIDFFLSCDGESIPLGTNWPERLNAALRNARLMFVFVSRASLESDWILFEAGYVFGQGKDVVPCCMPGVKIEELPPPFKLLQAQTLHSSRDLNALIRKCNDVFGTSIADDVRTTEFGAVFKVKDHSEGARTELEFPWHRLLEEVHITGIGPAGGADLFARICKRAGHQGYFEGHAASWRRFNVAGVSLRERSDQVETIDSKAADHENMKKYEFVVAPEMALIAFPLIDKLRKRLPFERGPDVEVVLKYDLHFEQQGHVLTTKLFGSDVEVLSSGYFGFRKMRFSLRSNLPYGSGSLRLQFTAWSELVKEPLQDLVTVLWQRGALWGDKSFLKELKQRG